MKQIKKNKLNDLKNKLNKWIKKIKINKNVISKINVPVNNFLIKKQFFFEKRTWNCFFDHKNSRERKIGF